MWVRPVGATTNRHHESPMTSREPTAPTQWLRPAVRCASPLVCQRFVDGPSVLVPELAGHVGLLTARKLNSREGHYRRILTILIGHLLADHYSSPMCTSLS